MRLHRFGVCAGVVLGFGASALAGVGDVELLLDAVTSDVSQSVVVAGEGTDLLSLAGGIGPVAGAGDGGGDVEFSLWIDLSFAGSSGPGDGFVSFLSLAPSYASGALEVVGASIEAQLLDGGSPVSSIQSPSGGAPTALPAGRTTVVGAAAFSFGREGFGAFQHIGDGGAAALTVDFRWAGSTPGDALTVELVPQSEIAYAPFIPGPGAAFLVGLGLLRACRVRRV